MSKKPMARAVRIALFQREIRVRLSPAAADLMFARADVISEGQRAMRGGRDSYFGSTMFTIDLPSLAELLSDACDAGTARRLAGAPGERPRRRRRVQATGRARDRAGRRCRPAPGRHPCKHPVARGQGVHRRRRRSGLRVRQACRYVRRRDLYLCRGGQDPGDQREQAALLVAGRLRRAVGPAWRQAGLQFSGPGERQGRQGAGRPRLQGRRSAQGAGCRARVAAAHPAPAGSASACRSTARRWWSSTRAAPTTSPDSACSTSGSASSRAGSPTWARAMSPRR